MALRRAGQGPGERGESDRQDSRLTTDADIIHNWRALHFSVEHKLSALLVHPPRHLLHALQSASLNSTARQERLADVQAFVCDLKSSQSRRTGSVASWRIYRDNTKGVRQVIYDCECSVQGFVINQNAPVANKPERDS
ncbi:uncharacterized protein UMAG_04570 [Mycosarcoma maydis]|uniref:Uncharacterized protein n=1 Tax=Mycosarcoma maydis TaxID=5270 RepID=A0A0D1C0P9_MYCMD|nr:uncharacterized protein UMAG_04570 [Ustilago maydis 521]KIS67472.1 hypothetical protein UMAG_04570 [Ustilago maydis 521]|eukprot:XP_011390881.1 hypothetical protein UMAG_04570 [Ustilago maydis 521]